MWIKPASDVTYRSRRRAVSVPADNVGVRVRSYDVGSGAGVKKAMVIASHANEDTDAIAAVSKRNDRDFLYDVSTKMANLATNANLPPRRSSSRDRSPSVRRPPPVQSTTPTPLSNYLRHAASLTPEDNSDIDAYLQWSPSSASHRYGASRSASLPPTSVYHTVPHPSVPRWYPSSVSYYGRSAGGQATSRGVGQTPLPVGLPPRPPSVDRRDAITDSVVGVAHTSLYGDIVIGIPYKKRFMFNAQRELDDLETQSLPAMHLPVQSRVSIAPRFANTRPASIALPSGTAELGRPYSRASYSGPAVGSVGSGYRPLAHLVSGSANQTIRRHYPSTSSSLTAADLDDAISIKSYPGVSVGGRSAVRTTRRPVVSTIDDFENDVDTLDFDDSGAVNKLSSLKRDAKSILSRYALPPSPVVSNGPKHMTTNELDQKYGQILSSMQAQKRIPPRTDYETSSLPPYPAKPTKPVMSDTRRKIRDLLCRSRNDPRYFDD